VLDAEALLLKNELIPEQFQGLERLAARQALLEALQEQGFLKESQEHKHAVGHCNRCGTAIEPYLSDQWYLSMNELARPAIAAVEEGRIKFTPERSAQTYLDWMRNIRDWNISRQLWWGHQIPIWTCENAHTDAYESKPECCLQCGSTRLEQDPDVLDTWFSSALWPFATLGWPDESQWQELFYPTAAVSTAREIINLWVSRMIFMSLRFTGKIPFKDILIHPVIQTPDGQRMSKSKNNVIDPLEMIDKYGTDANRFFFATLGIKGDQDVRFRHERLGEYKRFANKLYNAGRFIMLNIGDSVPAPIEPGSLSLADRWILHQYQCLLEKIDRGFTGFDFHEIAQALYEFSWDLFCDWYLEIAKSQLAEEGSQGQTRSILYNIFEGLLRALHPIMPFITEELWQDLPKSAERSLESIMFAPYPVAEARFFDEQADRDMSLIIRCIRAIREMRATYNVPASSQPEALFASEADADLNALSSALPYIERIARVKSISAESPGNKPANAASASIESIKIYLPLAKVIDIGKARIRLSQRKQALEKEIERQRATLENADFKAKAPKEKALSIAETLAQKQAQLTGILEQLSVIES
jgi:valyl-tRNA synthetase